MKHILYIIFILLPTFIFSQGRNDLKEYGFKGKVRSVTTYSYDTVSFNPSTKKITDTSEWRIKKVYLFDKEGNFDTIISYVKPADHPDILFITKTVYTHVNHLRVAVGMDNSGIVLDSIKFIYKNDSTYKTIQTDADGHTKIVADEYLNSAYREKAGKYAGYTNGKLKYGEAYVNYFIKGNEFAKTVSTDLVTKKVTSVSYSYSEFDGYNNGTKVIRTDLETDKAIKISLRKFVYY